MKCTHFANRQQRLADRSALHLQATVHSVDVWLKAALAVASKKSAWDVIEHADSIARAYLDRLKEHLR